MKALIAAGIVLLVLGVGSLFVPLPKRERHGVNVGGVSVGFETSSRETVHPAISAVLVAGGVVLIIAGVKQRR